MTSMLLTDRATCRAGSGCASMRSLSPPGRQPRGPPPGAGRSHLLAAIARRDLLLGRVLVGALHDHLVHERAVAGHERRQRLELLAVPLLELDHAGALV